MKILVERSTHPKRFMALSAIADTIRSRGHQVDYWCHTIDEHKDAPMSPCDHLVAWGQVTDYHRSFNAQANWDKVCVTFVGESFFRDKDKFQFAQGGVDSLATWALRLRKVRAHRQYVYRDGHPAILMQDHSDDLSMHSPWFRSSGELLDHIRTYWDHMLIELNESNVNESTWQNVSILFTLNSMVAMQAMRAGVPVATMAHAAYRHNSVTLNFDDDPSHLVNLQRGINPRSNHMPGCIANGIMPIKVRAFLAEAEFHEFGLDDLSVARAVDEILTHQAKRTAPKPAPFFGK